MPTLEWMGKNKVVAYHRQVPYRVLDRVSEKSVLDSRGSDCGIFFLVFTDFSISVFRYCLFVYIFLVNVDFVINWSVSLQDFILTNFLPDYLGRIGQ